MAEIMPKHKLSAHDSSIVQYLANLSVGKDPSIKSCINIYKSIILPLPKLIVVPFGPISLTWSIPAIAS
jgi:hypothetical protein